MLTGGCQTVGGAGAWEVSSKGTAWGARRASARDARTFAGETDQRRERGRSDVCSGKSRPSGRTRSHPVQGEHGDGRSSSGKVRDALTNRVRSTPPDSVNGPVEYRRVRSTRPTPRKVLGHIPLATEAILQQPATRTEACRSPRRWLARQLQQQERRTHGVSSPPSKRCELARTSVASRVKRATQAHSVTPCLDTEIHRLRNSD